MLTPRPTRPLPQLFGPALCLALLGCSLPPSDSRGVLDPDSAPQADAPAPSPDARDASGPDDAAVDAPAPGDITAEVSRPGPGADIGTTGPDRGAGRPLKDIEHLSDDALRVALRALVKGHTDLGYWGARQAMYATAGGGVDVVDGVIECLYTGRKTPPDGSNTPGGMNTEHSWPRSDGAGSEPAKSDINHLFPTDTTANSERASLPYGDTDCGSSSSCTWVGGGSMIGSVVGGTAPVFMVRPARRGDVARAHFYFAVRYDLAIPDTEEHWLRIWNLTDPPDSRERDRARAIEKLQKKRNPFVDRPDFVNKIKDF